MKISFKESYHVNPRNDILEIIPHNVECILDVGCGAGALGKSLKEHGVREVIGIELNKKAAEIASKYIDKVLIGDIEEIELPFSEEYFDGIIYADILEHLTDPWSVLYKHKKFLKCDGYVLISIPNIRHIHTFLKLLRGNWNYVDRGIFDRTHLRFFTLKSITQALNDAGYKIINITRNYRLFENTSKFSLVAKLLSCYIFRDFFVFQYLITAQKECEVQ